MKFFDRSPGTTISTNRIPIPDASFNYKNPSHLEIIDLELIKFNTALHALQTLDKNIIIGLAAGSVGYVGTYVFPLVLVSIAGFCAATHYYAMRADKYKQYQEALNDLIKVYQWSMGKETGDHWNKLAVKNLQELITTLGSWVSKETIYTWTEKDLKPASLSLNALIGARRTEIPEAFEARLRQLAVGASSAEWAYRLYGEHGIEDLFGALRSNVANQLSNVVTKVCTTFAANP